MTALIITENGLAAGIFQAVIDRIKSEQVIPEPATTAGAVVYGAGGAGAVSRTVEAKLRENISIADYPSLRAAIDSLPNTGGVINIPVGRWPAGNWKYDTNYMAKPNVTLRGARMPAFSANADRLEGGSVIEGRFNVFADHFEVENVGFDLGKYVVDTYYGGADTHLANHPLGDTWDAFAFAQPNQAAPLASRRGVRICNVVGLLRDSLSVGHAVLVEGVDGGIVDNVVGMYGVHAAVIKSKNITSTFFAGYGASVDDVILKSDNYARASNIKIDTVETGQAPPGIAPWSAPAVAAYGLLINPGATDVDTIKIGKARLFGAATMLAGSGGAGLGLDNVMIGALEIDGVGIGAAALLGIHFSAGLKYNRIRIGIATIANMQDGVAYANDDGGYGADALEFDSLTMTNVSLRGIQALGYGRVKVGRLRASNVVGMYAVDDTARVLIGREELINITTKFTKSAPALTAGWQQKASFAAFEVRLRGYGVTLKGMLEPTGVPSADVVTLPPYLLPAEPTHMAAIGRNAAAVDAMVALKITAGKVTINDGVGISGAQSYLSLSDISYEMD